MWAQILFFWLFWLIWRHCNRSRSICGSSGMIHINGVVSPRPPLCNLWVWLESEAKVTAGRMLRLWDNCSSLLIVKVAKGKQHCWGRIALIDSLDSVGSWVYEVKGYSVLLTVIPTGTALFNALCVIMLHAITSESLHIHANIPLQSITYLCADAWLMARFDSCGFPSGLRTWRAMPIPPFHILYLPLVFRYWSK